MSHSYYRSLLTLSSKLLNSNTRLLSSTKLAPACTRSRTRLAKNAPLHRSFTRSLWWCSSQTQALANKHQNHTRQAAFSKSCGCCALHTAGDKELVDFLSEEIKLERKSEKTPGKLPKLKGFEVTKAEGAEVELSRKSDNEQVTIRLNVNNSVEDEVSSEQADSQEGDQAQMVSKPPFVVEINKGGQSTLAIQCTFPPHDEMAQPPETEEQYEELVEIQEVSLVKHGAEWDEKMYTVSGAIMDGNLYDMLLNMLEERGIDAPLIDQLVEFCTAYEHKRYISFLEELKSFVGTD